eukprot:200967-Prymnesium_polylepis.1
MHLEGPSKKPLDAVRIRLFPRPDLAPSRFCHTDPVMFADFCRLQRLVAVRRRPFCGNVEVDARAPTARSRGSDVVSSRLRL